MNQQTFQQIREFAADIFGVDTHSLTPESAPETVETWDSVQHLNLVLAIEQHFGFQFDPEEIDGMKNVGAIAVAVDRKLTA